MASNAAPEASVKDDTMKTSEQHLNAKLEEMTVKDQEDGNLEVKQDDETGVIQVESLCMNCHENVSAYTRSVGLSEAEANQQQG